MLNNDDFDDHGPPGMDEVDSPQDDDLVISDCGRHGAKTAISRIGGTILGTFDTEESAYEHIRRVMDEQQFWPNVWRLDDHGGYTLITNLEW
jgi:hypothetical protein